MNFEKIQKYTKGTCTSSEKEEVENWLASENTEADASYLRQLWDGLDALPDKCLMEKSLRTLLQRIERVEQVMPKKKKAHTLYKICYRIAGILILPLLASWLTWHYVSSRIEPESVVQYLEYTVLLGEHKTIRLPDSTIVCLNTGSILIAPDKFTGNKRKVFLFGEGYFEVTPNKEKPFIVTTNLMDIEALGTAFCVAAYQGDNSVRTTLTEGSVRVSSTQNIHISSVVLTPSQQSYYTPEMDQIEVKAVNTALYTSWINGQFIFEETPFAEVIKRLEIQFGVEIGYNEKMFNSDKINAKFIHHESLPDILQALSRVAYFEYRYRNGVYQLRKK